ncbi:hypothetical protein THIARS_80300 [Thiomonas delicata]|uniref:Uncharacterized protein n=2 Tax=Thiomonas delicata TaxID=364030 RepID=A0A238D8Y9_THIDL|nr:hypothetical protein THIARS_80300 [Thiomonas delicata]
MPDRHPAFVAPHPWSIEQIAFDRIAHERIARGDTWFHVLAAASIVESLVDLYTHNLRDSMEGDAEASQWLRAMGPGGTVTWTRTATLCGDCVARILLAPMPI